jgi:hypothetical protein
MVRLRGTGNYIARVERGSCRKLATDIRSRASYHPLRSFQSAMRTCRSVIISSLISRTWTAAHGPRFRALCGVWLPGSCLPSCNRRLRPGLVLCAATSKLLRTRSPWETPCSCPPQETIICRRSVTRSVPVGCLWLPKNLGARPGFLIIWWNLSVYTMLCK